ncbi:MAG: toprim domain-containing protein [Planctomycetes bacterium]|nr:toprim domain-containing protein [Planctomycetota bacterium]
MAERPYVSFAEVKQKIPIPDVLAVLGLADRFTRTKGTLTGVCPLPSHQHGPNPNPEQFKINQREGLWLWHCFGDCQRGGDVIELVKAMTGYDNSHVRFWFAENFGDRLTLQPSHKRKDQASETSEAPKKEMAPANPGKEITQEATLAKAANKTILDELSPLKPLRFFLKLDPCVPYLFERGLKPETIRRFGIGLCQKGLLKGYVAIPVYNYPCPAGTNPIGYLGRWPDDSIHKGTEELSPPRYKFPADFPRNRLVYGLAEALEATEGQPLIVVEGSFKVYHLFQAGFSNTVATFGASVSDEQAAILAKTGRPLIFLFDGDDAGRGGAKSAAERLITQAAVRVINLPMGQVPDALSPVELAQVLS